jgi:hypothetical protein
MAIHRIICANCQTAINVDAQYAGRTGKCPKCKAQFIVPSTSASELPSNDLQDIASAAQPFSPPPPNGAKKKPAYVSALTVELNAREKPDYTAPIAIGIFSGVITAVVVSLLISYDIPKHDVPTPASPPIDTPAPPPVVVEAAKSVDASELAKLYDENEVAADATYKGKTIEVHGSFQKVYRTVGVLATGDTLDHPCVVLNYLFGTRVLCFFTEDDDAKLATLQPGKEVVSNEVIIRGVCAGKTIGGVELGNCTLISQSIPPP